LEEIEMVFNFLLSFYDKAQKSHVGAAAVLMLSAGASGMVSSVSSANRANFCSLGQTIMLLSVTDSFGSRNGCPVGIPYSS
jgi:hypothetical protein